MLFFKRILNFRREALAKMRDKRRALRYNVGPGFPLKATLNLVGKAGAGPRGSGIDWSGKLANLSTNGICVQLPPAAASARGEQTDIRLSLDDHMLVIPCTVAHFRVYSSYALCGVQLEFGDFKIQKAYLQLVEGVTTGASFVSTESAVVVHNPAGLAREQFRADNKSMLTAWRDPKTKVLDNFELVMGDHCVKGGARTALQVTARKNEKTPLSPIVDAEVRQLFHWVLNNLPKAVPADLRALMERSASGRVSPSAPAPAWAPPKGAAPGAIAPTAPPPNFAPPRPKSTGPGSSPAQWAPPPSKPKG